MEKMHKFPAIDDGARRFFIENGFIVVNASEWLIDKLEEAEKEIQGLFDFLVSENILFLG